MLSRTPVSPERRRDKVVGLLIIVLSFGGCVGLSMWGKTTSTPKLAPEPAPPSIERLPGFPDKVDPFALLERAQELSVRSKFRGFVATGVAPDGTIHLGKKKNVIRFSFQDPSGIGYQPPRAGGTLPLRRYCGLQSVVVRKKGIFSQKDQPERACPRQAPENLALPKKCTLEDVWEIAEKRRIKAKGTARIEYYDSTDGPAFRFKKDRHQFSVSARDCKKILKGHSGRGAVP